MVSGMDVMFSCIFDLLDVRMRIAITCIVPSGYLRGSSLKKKSASGGSFIRGKSLKEELMLVLRHKRWANIKSSLVPITVLIRITLDAYMD